MPIQIISFDEAAARGRFSRRTLNRLIAKGLGPPVVRLSPRRVGFFESDFTTWLAGRREIRPATKSGEAA
jgi:predicted DNA-binding transcriptional regulator AlpA